MLLWTTIKVRTSICKSDGCREGGDAMVIISCSTTTALSAASPFVAAALYVGDIFIFFGAF
jgi:hypothetical protein